MPGARAPRLCRWQNADKSAHSDAESLAAIRADLAASRFTGEEPRKVGAAPSGIRTSKPRVLRLMRAHSLLAPTRAAHCPGPRTHNGTIVPPRPDQMWGTDLTSTVTLAEGQAAVLVCVHHFRPGSQDPHPWPVGRASCTCRHTENSQQDLGTVSDVVGCATIEVCQPYFIIGNPPLLNTPSSLSNSDRSFR
jgi:hypothetical protein